MSILCSVRARMVFGLLFCFFLLQATAAFAQVTVTGTLKKSDGTTPIVGAFVFAQQGATFLGADSDGTDSSGVFSFTATASITGAQLIVNAPSDAFDLPAATFNTPASGSVALGTILAKPTVTVTGTLKKSDASTPIAGAFVFAQQGSTFLGADFDGTNSSGEFSFIAPASTTGAQLFVNAPSDAFDLPAATFNTPASGSVALGNIIAKVTVTITGTVKKSDASTPIAGAFVFAQQGSTFLGADFDGTNSSGEFSFVAPASTTGAQLFVNAPSDAFDLPAATFNTPASGSVALGNIIAKVTVTITGTVKKSDASTPIAGAFVMAQKGFSFLGADFDGTDSSGTFSFVAPANTTGVQLFVNAPSDAFDLPAATFTTPASGTHNLGNIIGKATVTVTGKVTQADGVTAIAGAFVMAQKGSSFLGADFDGTDSSGNFSFVAPASTTSVQLFVASSSGAFDIPAATFNTPASGSQNLGTLLAKASVTVTGTVKKSDGTTAISGAFVFAQKGSSFLGADFDGTDSSGNFSFVAPASTTGVQLFVNAPSDAFDLPAATFNTPASGTHNLGNIIGKATVTVTGKVTQADGTTAISGAFVFAQKGASFLGADFDGTDSSGNFSFVAPANTTSIQLFVSPTSSFTFDIPAQTFNTPASGTQNLGTIPGKVAVTVTGVVQNSGGTPVSGAFVFAQDASTNALLGGDYKFTDSSGNFSFSVPAGSTFKIFISATGLTFPLPAVNTDATPKSTFTAPSSGSTNVGTFKASP